MIVVGGYRTSNITTRTFDDDGNAAWTADHGDRVLAVAMDANGNVYTGGVRTSSLTTRKYNSSGTLQWSVDHGANVNAIAVDANGNVYTGGVRTGSLTTDRTTRKYNSSGTLQWSVDHGNEGTVSGVAVDADGNVYTAGNVISSNTTRKYNSSGTLQWSVDHGGWTWAVAVDADGNVYTAGNVISSNTTRKYNSSGTLQWSVDHGDDARGIAVDTSGNVYTTGDLISSISTRKYNSAGTSVWTADHYFMLAIAWKGLALSTAISGLAFPISLGIPFPTDFNSVPGLALNIAHGGCSSPDALTPDFADLSAAIAELASYDSATWGPYTGLSAAELAKIAVQIYVGVVAGEDSSMLSFRVSSLQCRRRVDASSWVSVITGYDDDLYSTLASGVGGDLLIQSGFRLPAGPSYSGPFLRMTLTSAHSEQYSRYGTITLTGRVINPPFTAITRTLTGIAQLQTAAGRRTVICQVDPLLRPNDIAIAGAETFTVGSIAYRIDAQTAVMTVTEA